MKTILVPIDFSENAETALYYALELAKKKQAKLVLFNAYQVNYLTLYAPHNLVGVKTAEAKEESLKQLKAAGVKVAHAGKVEYEMLSLEGEPEEIILKTIQDLQIDLVIMGMKGSTNLAGIIFGSTTISILENSSCPIIVVPEDAEISEIKKITYATAYNFSDIEALEKVVEIAGPFNAQINVLHICHESQSAENDKKAMEIFMEEVKRKITYGNISFQLISGKDIENVLEEYVEENNTDMLVMSAHHRDFFDKLFKKSITKHMVYHSSIPLMVFHYNSKSAIKLI